MSRPILAGYDPRRLDRAPVNFAVEVARFTAAPLIIASVEADREVPAPPPASPPHAHEAVDADLVDDCTKAIEDVDAELRALGISFDCVRVQGRGAARALHEEAERDGAALIAVGSSRRSIAGRAMLGGTALRLFDGAPCPVGVAPAGWPPDHRIRTIGVGYVDTEEGREALRGAHALAGRASASLRVAVVLKPTFGMHLDTSTYAEGQVGKSLETVEGEHKLRKERELRQEVAALGGDVPVEVDVIVGDPEENPAEHLVRLTDHLDLLVLGSRGYGPLRAVLLGSVSARVTAESRCPVIVVPRGVRDSLQALVTDRATAPV